RQRLRQREPQDVLDATQGAEVVHKPVVVQETPQVAVEQVDYLVCVESGPSGLGLGVSILVTEPLGVQLGDQFVDRGMHPRGHPGDTLPEGAVTRPPNDGDLGRAGPRASDHEPRAQEVCLFRGGVRDQRFLGTQFEFQLFPEEELKVVLEPLGERPGSDNPQDPVICVTEVPDPYEVRIPRVAGGQESQALREFVYFRGLHALRLPDAVAPLLAQADILRVHTPAIARLVSLPEGLDEGVEFVQVDIGEDGTETATLWGTQEGILPFTHPQVAGPQGLPDQPDEPPIGDFPLQEAYQHMVVNFVEARFDVALDDPGYRRPFLSEFPQG